MSEKEKESILLRMKNGLTSIPTRLKNIPQNRKDAKQEELKAIIAYQEDTIEDNEQKNHELRDTINLYKGEKDELIKQSCEQIETQQHLKEELKQSQVEIAALTDICYKKTEEALVAKKELEIYKKEREIAEKIKAKTNSSDYIG